MNKPQFGPQIPLALVEGQAVTELPKDLYIPPDALQVILETFEGPLDLLLYLIKRQNLDILNIPIAEITYQYMGYVEVMKSMHLELAAEYLVMAAMLAEIKSRMLLPKSADIEDEEDPRAELIRRLQEYEVFKQAAQDIDSLPRIEREIFPAQAEAPLDNIIKLAPTVELTDIFLALKDIIARAELFTHHEIKKEALSVRERMTKVLSQLSDDKFCEFRSLFPLDEGRAGVVVTLLAILELAKESLIEMIQNDLFAPIYVKTAGSADESATA